MDLVSELRLNNPDSLISSHVKVVLITDIPRLHRTEWQNLFRRPRFVCAILPSENRFRLHHLPRQDAAGQSRAISNTIEKPPG